MIKTTAKKVEYLRIFAEYHLGVSFEVMTRDLKTYVARLSGVEVKAGSILTGISGVGKTPKAAVDSLWDQVTQVKRPDYLVIAAYGKDRKAVRWTGIAFQPVDENP